MSFKSSDLGIQEVGAIDCTSMRIMLLELCTCTPTHMTHTHTHAHTQSYQCFDLPSLLTSNLKLPIRLLFSFFGFSFLVLGFGLEISLVIVDLLLGCTSFVLVSELLV